MPKSKEFISSGSDSDEPKSKKPKQQKPESKPSKSKNSDDGDSDMIQLGKMKYASVTEFKGTKYVNIREYYTDNAGDMKPGRKGIMLTRDQWERFKDCIDDLDAQMKG